MAVAKAKGENGAGNYRVETKSAAKESFNNQGDVTAESVCFCCVMFEPDKLHIPIVLIN